MAESKVKKEELAELMRLVDSWFDVVHKELDDPRASGDCVLAALWCCGSSIGNAAKHVCYEGFTVEVATKSMSRDLEFVKSLKK
ncbi:MAG: hypothetical protein LUI14_14485 [Lachnospiraceae bacterium]|nr:hypothetical protein [Lachnospiraceae bacterium]